MAQPDHHVRP